MISVLVRTAMKRDLDWWHTEYYLWVLCYICNTKRYKRCLAHYANIATRNCWIEFHCTCVAIIQGSNHRMKVTYTRTVLSFSCWNKLRAPKTLKALHEIIIYAQVSNSLNHSFMHSGLVIQVRVIYMTFTSFYFCYNIIIAIVIKLTCSYMCHMRTVFYITTLILPNYKNYIYSYNHE